MKPKYRTRQREILMDYLGTIPGVHITASDVCRYFRDQGASISQATVYRQLEQLASEGVIKKYYIDSSSPACFEYVAEDERENTAGCVHCKCEKCGRLIHLYCEELEKLQVHLYREHQFRVDPVRTVFYGMCEHCLDAGASAVPAE